MCDVCVARCVSVRASVCWGGGGKGPRWDVWEVIMDEKEPKSHISGPCDPTQQAYAYPRTRHRWRLRAGAATNRHGLRWERLTLLLVFAVHSRQIPQLNSTGERGVVGRLMSLCNEYYGLYLFFFHERGVVAGNESRSR